jgi:hypothetical protein
MTQVGNGVLCVLQGCRGLQPAGPIIVRSGSSGPEPGLNLPAGTRARSVGSPGPLGDWLGRGWIFRPSRLQGRDSQRLTARLFKTAVHPFESMPDTLPQQPHRAFGPPKALTDLSGCIALQAQFQDRTLLLVHESK